MEPDQASPLAHVIKKMNNTLIIFLENGGREIMSFPPSVSEEAAMENFLDLHPEMQGQIKKRIFTPNDRTPLDTYRNHALLNEDGELILNSRSSFVEGKVLEVRKKRDILIARLDVPFFKALEEDDLKTKNSIKNMKNFLRNLPRDLRFRDIQKEADIVKYDPFGNVFYIGVLYGGSGYTKPPKITIDSPVTDSTFGFAAEGVAMIQNGEVVGAQITYPGCGYTFVPQITVEEPESGEVAVVGCGLPQNTMIDRKTLKENSEARYSS